MPLAMFDLDNTLLNGDSDYLWGMYLAELGVVDRVSYEVKNLEFYEDYKAGRLDIEAFHAFSLKPLADHSTEDLLHWRSDFVKNKIEPLITQKARSLVEKHRTTGDDLLVITATNSFVTRPIVDCFGIRDLIGTDPEKHNGRFTGRISGIPSFREGKVTRLKAWMKNRNVCLDGSSFYSDSHNDLPLLQLVSHPVAVNPDDMLRAYAKKHAWPVISLRDADDAEQP
jgi:HAD superfamily hydrolase (TIGR01490 family)